MTNENAQPDQTPPGAGDGDTETIIARMDGRLDDLAHKFDRTDWVELLAAVILALATITAAWSAYQSSRWGGEQSKATAQAGALRISAAQALSVLGAQTEIDSQFVIAWLLRAADEDERGMAVLEERVGEELKPAFDAWLAMVPPGQIPPGTPLDLPEYDATTGVIGDAAVEFSDQANEATARAGEANQTSDDFVLIAVLMASVLFFAGVGTQFKGHKTRMGMVVFAALLFIGGLVLMLSLPQNVGL